MVSSGDPRMHRIDLAGLTYSSSNIGWFLVSWEPVTKERCAMSDL